MSASIGTRHLQIVTGISSIVAGLAWAAKDLGGRVSPDPDYWNCNSAYDYALNAVDTVAFLVQGLILIGLYRMFRTAAGNKTRLIGIPAGLGFVVGGVANLLEHCAGLDALGFAYVIGLMLGMLLLIVFELGLIRAGISTWYTGVLLLGTAGGILFANQGGLVAFGCSWIAFGIALLRSPPMLLA